MLTRQKLIGEMLIRQWSDSMCKSYSITIQNILDFCYEGFLSLQVETKIKKIVRLSEDEKKLLIKLLQDRNGIRWPRPTPGCPSKRLEDLALARWNGEKRENLLKASKFSFYPEIQYLVGLTKVF